MTWNLKLQRHAKKVSKKYDLGIDYNKPNTICHKPAAHGFRKFLLEDVSNGSLSSNFNHHQFLVVTCFLASFVFLQGSFEVMKGREQHIVMGEPTKPPCWTNLIVCFLFLAMLCLSCYNTIYQERLSAEVSELKTQVQIMKAEIFKGIPPKWKRHSRDDSDTFTQNIANPEGNKLEKFDWFDSGNFRQIWIYFYSNTRFY